jgi:trans-2,3-dihydro-3-hydroxyanthranilate isomerase
LDNYEIKYVDVFTTKPFSGNSAGVITHADGLTVEAMQRIAGEINLSESTFVTMPESGDSLFRVRFFTPSTEYDLSGHALIGTCFALAEEGRIPLKHGRTTVSVETNVGNIPVDFFFSEDKSPGKTEKSGDRARLTGRNSGYLDKIMMFQTILDHYEAGTDVSTIAGTLGIDPGAISRTGLPLEIVSSGLKQLLVPIDQNDTLKNLNPDMIKLKLMNDRIGVQTIDLFTLDALDQDCLTYSRHFSPGQGMWEDPGSGSAAVSIATYLARHGVISAGSHIMQQGKDLDSLSRVLIDISNDGENTDSAWVGGLAVTSIRRRLSVDAGQVLID